MSWIHTKGEKQYHGLNWNWCSGKNKILNFPHTTDHTKQQNDTKLFGVIMNNMAFGIPQTKSLMASHKITNVIPSAPTQASPPEKQPKNLPSPAPKIGFPLLDQIQLFSTTASFAPPRLRSRKASKGRTHPLGLNLTSILRIQQAGLGALAEVVEQDLVTGGLMLHFQPFQIWDQFIEEEKNITIDAKTRKNEKKYSRWWWCHGRPEDFVSHLFSLAP